MKAQGRYEIREILGEGGMGIVYRAFDPVMKREVALKTIRDPQDKTVLELFKRECSVLVGMTHPNIVEIFDIGETEEAGARRPYFVMPMLLGVTLDQLIRSSSSRLTVERSVQMISQVCRGLQAAHDLGLVHRDLKPSNLFVLDDDSVRIIDFGVAYLADHRSATGMKGTPMYMSPEQIQRKQPSPLSDQFSLAVVCYEMLARRHPFSVAGEKELAQAILNYKPAPVSDFNPLVSTAISQVIHKALAKEPLHRFSTVREFNDYLQKALRGESIDIFDPSRIAPRLQRARRAFDAGDLDFAWEILNEVESESYLTPEIDQLRKQIEDVQRNKTVKQLLETARRRFNEEEYVGALQKVQEVLNLDPANTDAFTLKGAIENKRSATQIEEWLRLANQHMENNAHVHARQALEKVLDLRPKDVRAQTLLTEVARREQEYVRLRNEKQQAYQSALEAYNRGDVNSAVNKLERVLDLDRRAPDNTSPGQGATYQRLYEEVRSRRDQLSSQEADARRLLNEGNFTPAATICDQVLAVYPNNVLFRVLRDDIEQAQRLEISAYVAKIEKDVSTEPDLNRRVSMLEGAKQKYPSEQRFEQSLQLVRSRRDLVDSIAGRARSLEEARQFSDALGQWETLRNIHPQYPGLEIEIDRLKKRREQQVRSDTKAHWVDQIDQALVVHNHVRAATLAKDGLAEFPGDAELSALARRIDQLQTRTADAESKAKRGKELYATGHANEALQLFRDAFHLDAQSPNVRSGLIEILLKEGNSRLDEDWRGAEPFVQEAVDLDPNNALAKSLGTLIQDKRQAEEVSAALSKSRELQAEGRVRDAVVELDRVLAIYPRETRLIQLHALLRQSLSTSEREDLRKRDLEALSKLAEESKDLKDPRALESIFQRSHLFSKYADDAEFRGPLSAIEERLRKEQEAAKILSVEIPASPGLVFAKDEPTPPVLATSPEKLRRLKIAIPERWRLVSSGPLAGILWAVIGFFVVGALMFWLIRRLPKPVPASSKLVTISVANPGDGYKILEKTSLADVTTESKASGLKSGNYTLTAEKPGFKPIKLSFPIEPSDFPAKALKLAWEPLPVQFAVKLLMPGGSLKVDNRDQSVDSSHEFKTEWPIGDHSIVWRGQGADSLAAEFVVHRDSIEMKPPLALGSAMGLVAELSGTMVTYRALNVDGITTIVGDQVEQRPSLGNFSVSAGQRVGFQTRLSRLSLGELPSAKEGQSRVYVYLAPRIKYPQPIPGPIGPKPEPKPVIPTCKTAVGMSSGEVAYVGGDVSVSIQTDSSCPWSISRLPEWITAPGGIAGDGSATITLVVLPNPDAKARSATISVSGQNLTITQKLNKPAFLGRKP